MLVNVINSGYLKQTMFAGSHSTAYACLQSSPFLEARPRAPRVIRREARLTNFDWGGPPLLVQGDSYVVHDRQTSVCVYAGGFLLVEVKFHLI